MKNSTVASLLRALLLALLMLPATASAQRRITPVQPAAPVAKTKEAQAREEARKNRPRRPDSVVKQVDDTGREFLLDTISGSEWVDSMALAQPKVIGNVYPLLHSVSVGVDLWDPLMRCFGQQYGVAGVWAAVNLHNRYIPVVEFGLGKADGAPAASNFTYHSPMAPYFKVGANYNFLYNSNPDYLLMAGVRYGITRFSYNLSDVQVADGYWHTSETFAIPTQRSTTGYLEVLLGLQVKIAGPVSAGWCIKYHHILHQSAAPYGHAWYVPGYGTRSGVLGVQLSVTVTLPLGRRHGPAEPESSTIDNPSSSESPHNETTAESSPL